jgi:hypothetical protein
MGISQTSSISSSNVVMGAAKIELLIDGSYVDQGVAREVSYNVVGTPLDVQVDNGAKKHPLKGMASQIGNMAFTLIARVLFNLYKVRGGIDVYTNTTATPVTGSVQNVLEGKWKYKTPIEIIFPSAVLPVVAIEAVTDGTLVLGTDFTVQKVSEYIYSVVLVTGTNVTTESQDLELTVDYTPLATEKLSTGGLVQQEDQTLRLTNKTDSKATQVDKDANPALSLTVGDPIFRIRRITAYAGTVTNGLQWTFLDKDSTDPVVVAPIEMTFEEDPDRAAGDQLSIVESYIIKQ